MSLLVATGLCVGGLVLVVGAAEQLVDGLLGAAGAAGISAFLLSVILIGFDPENLGVGVAGAYEGVFGVALGSVVGSAMVAVALALGVTALIVPLSFGAVPRFVLALPILAVLALTVLSADGRLGRIDGVLLLAGFGAAIGGLVYQERQGEQVAPTDAVQDEMEAERSSLGGSLVRVGVALVAVALGSELLVRGVRPLIGSLGLNETTFGMTVLALVISIEELAKELPAALRGRADISFGNVVGSALAFFLFNAGIIACVRPVPVDEATQQFYLPVCAVTVGVVALLASRGRIGRWGGALLVLLYALFAIGEHVLR